jgi:2-acylglycerol O-acyltransferase 2
MGVLPHRRKIITVVGAPVHPEEVLGKVLDMDELSKDPEKLLELTKKVHAAYADGLLVLWNKYKDQYAPNRTKELELVE